MAESQSIEQIVDRVFATALPIAVRAGADLRCSSASMALVGSIEAPPPVLQTNLDQIRYMKLEDWPSLLRCDLMSAISCVLMRTATRPEVLRMVLTSVHHILKSRHGWQQMAMSSNVHKVLVDMTLNPDLAEQDADIAFDILNMFLHKKGIDTLTDFYFMDLTVAAVGHCACRAPVLRVIGQMCRLNLSCRYILRNRVRANLLLRCAVKSLEGTDDEITAAAHCLCHLCDNDLHRTSDAMGPLLRSRLVHMILHGLKSESHVKRCASVTTIRSLLRRGVTQFEGQPKYKMRTSDSLHHPWILSWARSLGMQCISLLASIIYAEKIAPHPVLGIHSALRYLIQSSDVDRATYTHALDKIVSVLDYHVDRGINTIVIRTLMNIVVQLAMSSHEPLTSLIGVRNTIKTCLEKNAKLKREMFGETLFTCIATPDEMEKEPCSICFEDMSGDSCTTCCGHTFHCVCISNWFTINVKETCPMCRSRGLDILSDEFGERCGS